MKNSYKSDNFDYVFVDIYHDVSEALEVYRKMKEYEDTSKNTKFEYWLEETMKAYL